MNGRDQQCTDCGYEFANKLTESPSAAMQRRGPMRDLTASSWQACFEGLVTMLPTLPACRIVGR
jgi:hypothetical protein